MKKYKKFTIRVYEDEYKSLDALTNGDIKRFCLLGIDAGSSAGTNTSAGSKVKTTAGSKKIKRSKDIDQVLAVDVSKKIQRGVKGGAGRSRELKEIDKIFR